MWSSWKEKRHKVFSKAGEQTQDMQWWSKAVAVSAAHPRYKSLSLSLSSSLHPSARALRPAWWKTWERWWLARGEKRNAENSFWNMPRKRKESLDLSCTMLWLYIVSRAITIAPRKQRRWGRILTTARLTGLAERVSEEGLASSSASGGQCAHRQQTKLVQEFAHCRFFFFPSSSSLSSSSTRWF